MKEQLLQARVATQECVVFSKAPHQSHSAPVIEVDFMLGAGVVPLDVDLAWGVPGLIRLILELGCPDKGEPSLGPAQFV